jgi:hypothetical protein
MNINQYFCNMEQVYFSSELSNSFTIYFLRDGTIYPPEITFQFEGKNRLNTVLMNYYLERDRMGLHDLVFLGRDRDGFYVRRYRQTEDYYTIKGMVKL